jgi:hypothetical protein
MPDYRYELEIVADHPKFIKDQRAVTLLAIRRLGEITPIPDPDPHRVEFKDKNLNSDALYLLRNKTILTLNRLAELSQE